MNIPADPVIRHAAQWLTHANEDLVLARHALTLRSGCPYRLVAYHAQQCAEKSLKAFLVIRGIEFPYPHDLFRLVKLCPKEIQWIEAATAATALTPYAAATRYPGGELDVSRKEAVASVRNADRLWKLVRSDIVRVVREQYGKAGVAILGLGGQQARG